MQGNDDSILALFNADDQKQTLTVKIGASGRTADQEITVGPFETKILPLSQLLRTAKLNEAAPAALSNLPAAEPGSKNTKPRGPSTVDIAVLQSAREGEISWFTADPSNLFGRVLVTRRPAGQSWATLESFSCGYNIVLCGAGMYNPFAQIDFYTAGFVGPINPSYCTSFDPNGCSGDSYGSGGGVSYSWTSTDNNITPISGSATNSDVSLFGQILGNGGAQGRLYNQRCTFYGSGTATVVCPVPTGDTTAFDSWSDDQGQPAIGKWVQTLTPAGNYVGQHVFESDASPATDTCWFDGSQYPPTEGVSDAHTGKYWTVATSNQFYYDYVGAKFDWFSFYQKDRRARGQASPCNVQLFQNLSIQCSGGSAQLYKRPVVLQVIVSATGISSGRDGQLVGRELFAE